MPGTLLLGALVLREAVGPRWAVAAVIVAGAMPVRLG
jgi:hypothetical protein